MIDIEIEFIFYRITNIYAPNIPKKRKFFFQKLEAQISNNLNNILRGDFNMVEDISKDSRWKSDDPTLWHKIYKEYQK